MLNESIFIKFFVETFLLRRLESCAATGKAVIVIAKINISRATHSIKTILLNKLL